MGHRGGRFKKGAATRTPAAGSRVVVGSWGVSPRGRPWNGLARRDPEENVGDHSGYRDAHYPGHDSEGMHHAE